MSQERTEDGVVNQETAPPGVSDTGTTATPPVTGGTPTPQQQPQQRVNLDDLPDFRAWKSRTDQRIAESERRVREAEERAETAREESLAMQMQTLPPDQREQLWQQQLQRERQLRRQAEQARLEEKQARDQAQALQERANAYLKEMGIEINDPAVDWSGGPSAEGLNNLYASVGRIIATRSSAQEQVMQQQTETVSRETRRQTLAETGVSRVSTATPGAQPALSQQYRDEMAKAHGVNEVMAIRRKYKAQGLPLGRGLAGPEE